MFQPRKDKHPGFGLTDHDKKNVNYLLSMGPEQLAEWISNASEDDLLYAKELAEVNHILNIDKVIMDVPDYQAAAWVLQKYMPVVQKPVAKPPVSRRLVAWLQGLCR